MVFGSRCFGQKGCFVAIELGLVVFIVNDGRIGMSPNARTVGSSFIPRGVPQ